MDYSFFDPLLNGYSRACRWTETEQILPFLRLAAVKLIISESHSWESRAYSGSLRRPAQLRRLKHRLRPGVAETHAVGALGDSSRNFCSVNRRLCEAKEVLLEDLHGLFEAWVMENKGSSIEPISRVQLMNLQLSMDFSDGSVARNIDFSVLGG